MIVDVHHHYIPKQYFDEIATLLPPHIEAIWENGRVSGRERATGYIHTPAINPVYWCDVDLQLRLMDAAGIDHAVLSIATYVDWMTIPAARIINDSTAELVRRHPDRFSGVIAVPPDGGEEMRDEIERARGLGLCGLTMTTSSQGRYPDHEDFKSFLQIAAESRLPILLHPSWSSPLPGMDRWNLERSLGKPTDMVLGIANLMYNGTFNDLPGLRVVGGHLGGSLPITLRRMFLGLPGYLNTSDYDYPALLRRLYIDTAPGMWQSPLEVEAAARIVGVSQTLFGSDYPLGDPETILQQSVDHVRLGNLSENEQAAILSKNAIGLFRLHHLGG